jgi:ABC-type transporter Mla MlaB component
MIRIETSERRDLVTIALSGHIQAEELPELKRVMESYSKQLVLDLTGVKLVDRDVITFLADFEVDNGRITNCPSYIREWIRREQAETAIRG